MTRPLRTSWATLITGAIWLLWSGCLQVETQFCGDVLCPRGTVCSNIQPDTCVPPAQRDCGDGVIDDNEVCDDGGDQGPGSTCSDDCLSDLSCGNGIVDAERGEECDCGWNSEIAGSARVSEECEGRPNGAEGGLCNSECYTFCGDGTIAGSEECDGSDLGGLSCTDYGFDIGELQCSRCEVKTRGCAYIGWYLEETPSSKPLLRAVHGVELSSSGGDTVTHVFAVGDRGWFRHHDGESWRTIASSALTTDLFAVFAAAPDEVYVAGADGVIARYDGQRVVVEHRDPAGGGFVSIWAGDNDPIALAQTGRVWQRTMVTDTDSTDGEVHIVWKEILKLPTRMSAMWVREPGDLFVLSVSGDVYHYIDNVRVDRDTLDDSAHYRALFGHGQMLIAVGDGGAVRRYDGAGWQARETLPGQPDLTAAAGRDPFSILVAGENGAAWRWNGSSWRQLNTRPLRADADEWYRPQRFADIWTSSRGAVFAVDLDDTAPRRGIWRYHGTEWVFHHPAPDSSSLRAVWGAPDSTLHALSDNGYHLFYDGSAWAPPQPVASGGESVTLNALIGRDSGVLFAAGDNGAAFVYRAQSGAWALLDRVRDAFPAGEAPDFLALWTSPEGELFLVGTDGAVLRCRDEGAACAEPIYVDPVNGHDQVALTAVWGRSSDEVYAVGDNGVIYKFTSDTMVDWQVSYQNENLPSLTGLSGAGDVIFAVGRAGTVLSRRGQEPWYRHTELPGDPVELRAVFALADDRAYAAGDAGALWRYDGALWQPVKSFTDMPLTAVWGTDNTVVVARGDGVLGALTLSDK